ncbi:MAG: 6-carboxytetrahydropterin synthase [Campylobacteraceae bacterium]|jgi:6-pyruvoyltetrahydropterin/6-carboxytetrahydropterin synthase|nr:6-carboxytetrahydropterin synthase [Campylobacteraceae bacterium]
MIIRKVFKFENTHIVRRCSSKKCRSSIHGHSYKVEVLFESDSFDDAQMVYDFGLMKTHMQDLVESFDHSITLWSKDDEGYVAAMKKYSDRWVELPVNPTAEQFARVIFLMIDLLLSRTIFTNKEGKININSVIVHETDSGYAKASSKDAYSESLGMINANNIIFSNAVKEDWRNPELWQKILDGENMVNPKLV